jgi:GT2 family glycosyltransferase
MQLRRCLVAARAVRSAVPWEVLVVDNGSWETTMAVVREEQRRGAYRLRLVSESTIGLGRARNAGWRAARGALLAFVDDDCYLTETYIDDLLEVFRARPDVGFVAGRISLFDSGDLALTFDDCARAREYEPYRFVPAGSLHGANLTFRREVLGLIGGFNPLLGAGTAFEAGEDVEAVATAVWRGVRGVYDPRPRVFHHHQRRTRGDRRAILRRYDVGRGAYYACLLRSKAARSAYVWGWIYTTAAGTVLSRRPGRPIREVTAALRYRRAHAAAATPPPVTVRAESQ